MGLFSIFNKKNGQNYSQVEMGPEIPEHVFIEKNKVPEGSPKNENGMNNTNYGIKLLFQFLDKNYEEKGYDDALVNPDGSHLDQNVTGLKCDLDRTIKKVRIFYEDFIREINVHLATRRRSGMIDIVEELVGKKETAESHMNQVVEIEQDAKNDKGVGQGIILSYTRGFRNGLAAISHHSILRKNF